MAYKILVVGSIGFDVIFKVHGDYKKEIPIRDGVINNVNIMLTAKNKKEYFGGTGANIAYGLGLLKEKPVLFSIAGKDYTPDYEDHLIKNGVVSKVIEKENEFTATFYSISDEAKQQIGIWQPNAYGNWVEKTSLFDAFSKTELKKFKIAIFSPGTAVSMRNMIREFREFNSKAIVIFDPSQVLSIFDNKKILLECISYSNIFIGNDTEIAQLEDIFNLDVWDLLQLGLDAVIETKGDKGVTAHTQNSQIDVPAFKPKRVSEATGAGDAFRSGFVSGLVNNRSLEQACKIGAYMGAKCVEEFGAQLYKINPEKDLKL